MRTSFGFPAFDGGLEGGRARLVVESADRFINRLGGAAAAQGDHGAPQARASTGTMPKSSSPGKSRARQRR